MTSEFLARFGDALAEQAAKPPSDPVAALSYVAFAALAVALGCPPERVGDLHRDMHALALPAGPQAAVDQFRTHIDLLREDGL